MKKNIIRLVCLLALLTLLSTAVACKTDKPTPAPTSTKGPVIVLPSYDFGGREFKIFLGGVDSKKPFSQPGEVNTRYRERIKCIEDTCNAKVTFFGDGGWASYQAIIPAIVAGTPPVDVMDQGPANMDSLKQHLVAPIEQYDSILDIDNPDLWDQTAQDNFRYDGHLYGVATRYVGSQKQMESVVLFYNKDLLTESGVTDNLYELQKNKQWTWDKYSEIAIKVTKDKDGDGKTDIWGAGGNNHDLMVGFINGNGGKMFGKDSKGQPDFLMDRSAAREAFQYLVDMAVKDKSLRPRPDEEGSPIDIPLFNKNKMGFVPEHLNRIDPNIGGFSTLKNDWGVLLFPIGPKMNDYVVTMSYFNIKCVVNGADDPESIAKFIHVMFYPAFTQDESDAVYEEPLTEYLRDEGSIETVHMMTEERYTTDQCLYNVLGTTFFVIDGSEPVYRGEKTVQQFYDELKPLIMEKLRETWTPVIKDYNPE